MSRGWLTIAWAAALAACPNDAPVVPNAQPEGWQDDLALASLEDLDPAPNVVEVALEARIEDIEFLEGLATPAWTFNGSVPGPLIQGKVGDRLVVHFTNRLPEPTTIHWHGLRLPNAMDGVPNISQPPVQPGETFTYDFVLRDAGAYWYHPHINSAAQIGQGMYGALIVDDADEPEFGDEIVLVLSDMSLDHDTGEFLPPDHGGEFGDLFGREGHPILVNGKVNPTLHVRSGRRQRWRVVNAARSRYFTIGYDGQSFTRIGNDGGFAAAAVTTEAPVLVPGERADLLTVPAGAPGSEVQLEWLPTERGYGSTFMREPEPLFRVKFDERPTVDPGPEVLPTRTIAPVDISSATDVDIEFTIDETPSGQLIMGINHVAFAHAEPFRASVGETQVWRLSNATEFAHPFHLHGYFFQVLDVDGVPIEPLAWRDTVDVPVDSTVRIAIPFDERPGTWMFHCHVLDHAEKGMMAVVEVAP